MFSKFISQQDQLTLYNWAESKPFVKRLWVFGSRARGDYKPDSDLDVAIEIDAILPSDPTPHVSFRFRHKGWVAEIQPNLSHRLHLCHYDPEVPENFDFDFIETSGVSTRVNQVSIAQGVNRDGALVYDYAKKHRHHRSSFVILKTDSPMLENCKTHSQSSIHESQPTYHTQPYPFVRIPDLH